MLRIMTLNLNKLRVQMKTKELARVQHIIDEKGNDLNEVITQITEIEQSMELA